MSKKKENDIKKHFEAILGEELEREFPNEISLRERIAIYTEQKGKLTSREIGTVGNSTKACADTSILDISGIVRTGRDGTAELTLSDFFCSPPYRFFSYPVIVVATPRAQSPVFVTVGATVTSNPNNVRIKVATWNASGSPVPNQSLNWACRVPITYVAISPQPPVE